MSKRLNAGVAIGSAVLGALCASPAAVPIESQQELPHLGARPGSVFDSSPEQDPVFAARRLRALNAARQKALVSDTEKLLALTRELDATVQGSGGETLTPQQAARLAQIEKLARHVKDKMIESDADLPGTRPVYSTSDR